MNLFHLPTPLPDEESFEPLLSRPGLSIERIISTGQASPEGFWYDQPRDEWVVLLTGAARLEWEDGRARELTAGDWVLIPAREKHRVASTSKSPPCVWLAVHFGETT